MELTITIPSKTFLVGEYTVLQQGPGLILATQPRFRLQLSLAGANSKPLTPMHTQSIHPQSPAGKFYHNPQNGLLDYQISFHDPHQGCGGLGASSAQFAMLLAAREYNNGANIHALPVTQILQEYQHYAWNGSGVAPSGIDVVGQIFGSICYCHRQTAKTVTQPWPFPKLGFYLIKTGSKLATHDHLTELALQQLDDLSALSEATQQSLQNNDENAFCECINGYHHALQQHQFVAQQTIALLADLAKHVNYRAAKGCGALGIDVILVVMDKAAENQLQQWIRQHNNLQLIATDKTLSDGIILEENPCDT